jgi:hypothetical protein
VLVDQRQRLCHICPRTQDPLAIPLDEQPSPAAQLAVEVSRDANGEPLQPSRERRAVWRLANELDAMTLHRKMSEPESETILAHREASA